MLHFPMYNLRHKILKVSPLHNNIITCPFICLSKKKKKSSLIFLSSASVVYYFIFFFPVRTFFFFFPSVYKPMQQHF